MQSTTKHHYNNIKKYFIKEVKNKKYRKAILLINSVINLPKKYGAIYQRRGYNEEFETDYSTVGGFCQEILDRFAKTGDEFDFSHYHFVITDADEYTVEKLKVIDNTFEEEQENQ